VLLPNARVLTAIFFFLIFFQELPAVLFIGFWFFIQLWQGGFSLVQPDAGGGVAFFAHIGGFVFGVVTVHLVTTRPPLRPAY
jgi:membrane associated rhomboid family serine protease